MEMILPSFIEKPEGQPGPGHLTPSLKMAGWGLGTWHWACHQLRSVSLAGSGHWQEDPDWVLDEHAWAGTPSLSQDLDLRRWKLSLGTLLFFIRTENNICFGEVYRNLVTFPWPTSRTKDLTPSCCSELSHVWLFATPWTAAHQASLFFTISRSFLKLMSIESVMLSNHLVLCCPLLLLSSIFPFITVFSNESALCIQVAKVLELWLQQQLNHTSASPFL